MSELNVRQQAFVNAYLQCWNATQAAIQAGYSTKTAYSQGSRLLKHVEIKAAIQQRFQDMTMGGDETLARLSDIASSDISDFIRIAGKVPIIDFGKAQNAGKLHLLKKLTIDQGKISFELYDKQAALNTIAKHHGLLTDKIQIDVTLVAATLEALESLGQDPSAVFNEIIARAKQLQDAGS